MDNIIFKFDEDYDYKDNIISYFVIIKYDNESDNKSENNLKNATFYLYDNIDKCKIWCGFEYYSFEIIVSSINNKYYGQVTSFDSNPRSNEYKNKQYEYKKNNIDNIINIFLNKRNIYII